MKFQAYLKMQIVMEFHHGILDEFFIEEIYFIVIAYSAR